MSIDYHRESEKYKPIIIKTLLIGEAPPPFQKTYFYVSQIMNPQRDLANYISLPATIFNHYLFKKDLALREYEKWVFNLEEMFNNHLN